MGFLFKGFSKKGEWYFRNTIWDYIILLGAMAVFLHAFFTIEYVTIYSRFYENNSVIIGYGLKMGVQVILAPLIAMHRVWLIILGNNRSPKLRAMQLSFRLKLALVSLNVKWENENKKLTKKQKIISKILWFFCAMIILLLFILCNR